MAQLVDIFIFDKLRNNAWWYPPLISSFVGSIIDTCLFFHFCIFRSVTLLGESDGFALEAASLLAVFSIEVPRWVSWALGDMGVKFIIGLVALIPYWGVVSSPQLR